MIAGRTLPLTFAALAALALAGCAAREPAPPPPAPVGGATLPQPPNIDWHTGLADGAVRLELVDPDAAYVVEHVALKGPAGQVVAASEMTRASGPGGLAPSYGVGGGFGSHSGGGVGFGMSVPLGATGGAPGTRTFVTIPLPDPAEYRRTARNWTIEVTLRDREGTPYHASIPAPLP